ncbi:MAG TPA: hypothetical protein ENJ31_07335 [Anaerolineae bacterium]|nr:hypothetical protein [Anaerolineae bacterium]
MEERETTETMPIEPVSTEESATGDTPLPAPEDRRDTRRTVMIVVIALVVFAILIAAFYGLATHPVATAILRDIAIIVLALVTIVIGAFLAILIFQLQSLIALLRDEIQPILESANETANTVRGTTTFVTEAMVSPVISAASYIAAIRQTLRVLRTNPRKKN